MIWSILIVGLVVVFTFLFNSLILKRNVVDNAMALVDAHLKRRCDLVAELIAATSGHWETEANALAELAVFRRTAPVAEKAQTAEKLNRALEKFMAQVEASPEFKDVPNILELQSALRESETQSQSVRDTYNSVAADFNNTIQTPPGSFFAKLMKLTPRELFP